MCVYERERERGRERERERERETHRERGLFFHIVENSLPFAFIVPCHAGGNGSPC